MGQRVLSLLLQCLPRFLGWAEVGHRLTILDRQNNVLSQWGEAGDEPHQFVAAPHGIWGDSRGDLYVSEVAAPGLIKKFVRVRD